MRLGLRLAVALLFLALTHAGVFVLIYVVPSYKKKWGDLGADLSNSKRLLIELSDWVARYWYAVLPAFFLVAVLFVVTPFVTREFRTNRPQTLEA